MVSHIAAIGDLRSTNGRSQTMAALNIVAYTSEELYLRENIGVRE